MGELGMKKFVAAFLAVLLLFSYSETANAYQVITLDNFTKDRTYTSGVFSDNKAGKWFYDNVVAVYEYGLMDGIGNKKFNPDGKITIAEAITVAVRINWIYNYGGLALAETEDGDQWYDPYVRAALRAGIISGTYSNYNANATRAEFMKILAESIDSVDLEAINIVDDGAIPDVDMSADYADAVYLLYRAGVLTGSDSMGTFAPKSVISRAEAAAVITRIIDPTLRTSVELVGEY
jgi:hypothetical protein